MILTNDMYFKQKLFHLSLECNLFLRSKGAANSGQHIALHIRKVSKNYNFSKETAWEMSRVQLYTVKK